MQIKIKSVCVPQVYIGINNPDIDNEMKAMSNEVSEALDRGFRLRETHTMVVGHVGYLVYVMIKEE